MRSTAEVLDQHLKCFANRDLDGILRDYSADALFFAAEGALRGLGAIRAVFEKMLSEFAKQGYYLSSRSRPFGDERNRKGIHRQNVAPDGNEPRASKILDTQMLVMESREERPEDKYRRLLEASDFRLTRSIPTQSPYSVIEGEPA